MLTSTLPVVSGSAVVGGTNVGHIVVVVVCMGGHSVSVVVEEEVVNKFSSIKII